MATITISGSSLQDIVSAIDGLRGGADPPIEPQAPVTLNQPAASPETPATEPQKGRSRKRVEAPAPIQPNPVSLTSPGPAPLAQPTQQPQLSAPVDDMATFSPNPSLNGAAPAQSQDRPAVAKFRNHLLQLIEANGESGLQTWLTKAFGLSASVTVGEFLSNIIYQQADDVLLRAYGKSGGK